MQCLSYTLGLSGSEVIADNRLCGLCNGIIDHEDDREEVTGNTECCHSVFTEMADENVVPQKHHTGNGGFTDKSRTSQFNHITDVAKSQ